MYFFIFTEFYFIYLLLVNFCWLCKQCTHNTPMCCLLMQGITLKVRSFLSWILVLHTFVGINTQTTKFSHKFYVFFLVLFTPSSTLVALWVTQYQPYIGRYSHTTRNPPHKWLSYNSTSLLYAYNRHIFPNWNIGRGINVTTWLSFTSFLFSTYLCL